MRCQVSGEGDPIAASVKDAGTNLRFSTMALRSCYSVNCSGVKEFLECRAKLTDTACAYKDRVLPLAIASLQKVKEFILYFKDMTCEECLTVVGEILQDAQTSRELVCLSSDTHKAIAGELKGMQSSLDTVFLKCELGRKRYEEDAARLRMHASSKETAAAISGVVLAICPLTLPLAVLLIGFAKKGSSDRLAATVAEEEAELAVKASCIVKDTLAPAIERYCAAMDRCAGEFDKLTSDIIAFEVSGKKLETSKAQAFHKVMKKRADCIYEAVEDFLSYTASAETDLMSLPAAPTPNYVQQWLAEHGKTQGGKTFAERVRSLGGRALKVLEAA